MAGGLLGAWLMEPGIELAGLSVAYEAQSPALENVSGLFRVGSATAIVGPNGAGKSTLLKAVLGLLAPAAGNVLFHGCAREDIAYLPQRAEIDRSFPITTLDLVLLGQWRQTGAFRGASLTARRQCEAALAEVGLADHAHRPIGALSIGQFQRALFARLMVENARIILLDEPFAGIDNAHTGHLLRLIAQWRGEGRTIIAALHDLAQVRDYFGEALVLDRRVLGWGATADMLQRARPHDVHLDGCCDRGAAP